MIISQMQGDNFPELYAKFRLNNQDEDIVFEYDKQHFWIFLSDKNQVKNFLIKFLALYKEKINLHQSNSIED